MSQNPAIEWIPFTTHQEALVQQKHKEPAHKINGKPNGTGRIDLNEHALELLVRWKEPRRISVNSMRDLFQESVPFPSIVRIFKAMDNAPQHVYQVLTERSDRLLQLSPHLPWKPNIWMGVTLESKDYLFRIQHLRQSGAYVKYLAMEPLLGSLPNLNLEGIDWVVVGGDSGPGAKLMKPEWVTDIRDQCIQAGVPFFFKGWGGRNKKLTGRMLGGRTWDEMPASAYV